MGKKRVPRMLTYFSEVEDPRAFNRRHRLIDILVIAVCAVLCNADSWEDVEVFGQLREKWFRRFLALPHGIPSHDTFRRVFRFLKPEAFQKAFLRWMEDLRLFFHA